MQERNQSTDKSRRTRKAKAEEVTKNTDISAREETERLYAILSPLVGKKNNSLSITIQKKQYELKSKTERGNFVRMWVFDEYCSRHHSDYPRVSSLDMALARIFRDHGISEDTPQKKTSRNSKDSRFAELEQEIERRADFKVSASVAGTCYVRVPYSADKTDESNTDNLCGLWLIGSRQPIHLLKCYLYFSNLNRPYATSKSTDYSGTLHATNAQGKAKTFAVDREAIEEKGLDAKFKGFCVWPKSRRQKDWLLEIIDCLMEEKQVTIHDQQESLGWVEAQEKLIWVANNALETVDGFIASEQAPFTAPSIVSPGNGYRATPSVPVPNDEIWELFLGKLNESNWERLYGKLGAFARVMFPEGIVEHAGSLPFAIETVGDGSGQGKSAEDNFILSLYGIDFTYDRSTYLSETDTQGGRLRPMSKVKYCLFTDYDRKARPGNNLFDKQHESRKLVIDQYADHTGGGTISSRDAQKERARGKPSGGALLTGNFDHSPISIEREEEMIEYRVCTFIVQSDEKADMHISREINNRRIELYSWGVAFRRWFMQHYNSDKQAFILLILGLSSHAEKLVLNAGYDWPHTRYINQCIDLVWGVLTWKAFLQEHYPNSFLLTWLDTFTDAFISTRYQRACYVQGLVDSRKGSTTLDEFVLDTIRYELGTGKCYVRSQQDGILSPDEMPVSPTQLGYKSTSYNGTEVWDTGQTSIGHYVKRKEAIAFLPNMLYQVVLKEAARKKFPVPSSSTVFNQKLAETGLIACIRNDEDEIVRSNVSIAINGKSKQCLLIPLNILYPEPSFEEIHADLIEGEPEKVVSLNSAHTRQKPILLKPGDEILDPVHL